MDEEELIQEVFVKKLKTLTQQLNNLADELNVLTGQIEHDKKIKQEQKKEVYE